MSRNSEARRFILQALLNDYESLESLAKYHLDPSDSSFSRDEIRSALTALLESRHVEAFLYSSAGNKFISTNESLDSPNELWFGLSQKGRDAAEKQ